MRCPLQVARTHDKFPYQSSYERTQQRAGRPRQEHTHDKTYHRTPASAVTPAEAACHPRREEKVYHTHHNGDYGPHDESRSTQVSIPAPLQQEHTRVAERRSRQHRQDTSGKTGYETQDREYKQNYFHCFLTLFPVTNIYFSFCFPVALLQIITFIFLLFRTFAPLRSPSCKASRASSAACVRLYIGCKAGIIIYILYIAALPAV